MPENNGCGCNSLNNQSRSGCCGLFGNSGCGCGDSTILFFIIIFLLLFTNFGCCGCDR